MLVKRIMSTNVNITGYVTKYKLLHILTRMTKHNTFQS